MTGTPTASTALDRSLAKDLRNLAETLGSIVTLALIRLVPRRFCENVGCELEKPPVGKTRLMVAYKRERFRCPGVSGRCRFGQGIFAGPPGTDDSAPKADLQAITGYRSGLPR